MPKIHVTEHAFERLRERVGSDPRKAEKIARKAWMSKERVDPGMDLPQNDDWQRNTFGRTFRKFMGKVYVFAPGIDASVTLVTVIPTWKASTWSPPASPGDRGNRLKKLDFLRKIG